MAVDTFGITKLNATTTGGREWFNTWGNGVQRVIRPVGSYVFPPVDGLNRDPQDSEFLMLRYGDKQTLFIHGDGLATWKADSISVAAGNATMGLYIIDYPTTGLASPWLIKNEVPARKTWTNTEMTIYVKFLEKVADGNFRLAARSDHYNIQNCRCDGLGYDFQLETGPSTTTGMRLGTELIHDVYDQYSKHGSAPTPSTNNINQVSHANTPRLSRFNSSVSYLELYKWYGMKFVCRTKTASNTVLLEGYLDKSDGASGGNWIKMMEYESNGIDGGVFSGTNKTDLESYWTWTGDCGEEFAADTSKFVRTPQTNTYNPVRLTPAYSCYIRADNARTLMMKNFSIREVDAI